MSEWNIIHENFHTQHSVLTAPDEHMPYIIQLHIMSIWWAYYDKKWSSRTSDQFIWLVSEKKTEPVNACLIKNSKGDCKGGGRKNKTGEGVGRKAVRRTGRSCMGVYKIGLKWPAIAMAITWKPQSLSVSERDRELELEP